MSDWKLVEAEINHICAVDGCTQGLVSQVRDLSNSIRNQMAVPEILSGYWKTSIRFCWPKVEVEVFEDRFELYLFPPNGRIDIRYFDRLPGTPISPELTTQLLVSQS